MQDMQPQTINGRPALLGASGCPTTRLAGGYTVKCWDATHTTPATSQARSGFLARPCNQEPMTLQIHRPVPFQVSLSTCNKPRLRTRSLVETNLVFQTFLPDFQKVSRPTCRPGH